MNKAISPLRSPSKRLGWLMHLVAWGVLLTIPFVFVGRGETEVFVWHRYLSFLLVLSSYVVAFYTNYLFLVEKFLFTRQIVRYLLSNILLITALFLTAHSLMELFSLHEQDLFYRMGRWERLRFVAANMLGYSFIIAISLAYKMTASWYAAEAERKELEQSRSEAELQNLKSQLNPHFLFNTLNNIYSLIAISPERAQKVVHELSRLLRYVLYESGQPLVAIEKDMDFLRNYVELMRIRLPGHITVTIDVSYTSPDLLIAPLLFIAPIENAFKHGVNNSRSSFLHLEITDTDKEINGRIRNSYFPKGEQDKSGSGIGLSNLQKRLDLIYPGRFTFDYGKEGDTYHCALKLCQLSLK
jgi:sensor histidine kinase YesM